ncbi:branched-chain amino acid transport system II carrier protein [Jeotgalibacillus terrae]|uniref:Branched-chain amino acid transport system carrier protein n=1 Tax=Jeotgalibacillus terrae TaxID=587735 RepID=A0ABW5ZDL3_9BACL|nr:branched-chain amino acid transport system II carrier protein [Jeotgalibacillus terrae]MBM7580566.1 LIVCS family branched-chain amino acid:cation transporter [Jeotgalibacillus terrae]
MQQKIPFSTYLIIGTMLFGLFFGAGNLIFPIQLGQLAGTSFWPALAGFLVTAIGLPLLGILAIGLSGSKGLHDLASRVHPLFGTVFALILYLTIGPFFAIPRTATVPYTVGFEPFVSTESSGLWLAVFSFIFFAIVYVLSLKAEKVMDIVGRYLTPVFLFFLSILIITAIIQPMGGFGAPAADYQSLPFMSGFREGYNTMDALGALAFGIIVIHAIKNLGITDKKAIASTTLKSGLIATGLMMLIYGLITYMGATSPSAVGTFENGGLTFAAVAQHYFGPFGAILLALIIVLACVKTSIGLIIACSEFFHQLYPKVSYKTFVLILSLMSLLIANFGLTNIIQYAVPVLMFLYPLAIVLILLGLTSNLFGHKRSIYAGAMFLTFFVSLIDGYNALVGTLPGIANGAFDAVTDFYMIYLPLYEIGLGWILPALVGAAIGFMWRPASSGKVSEDLSY